MAFLQPGVFSLFSPAKVPVHPLKRSQLRSHLLHEARGSLQDESIPASLPRLMSGAATPLPGCVTSFPLARPPALLEEVAALAAWLLGAKPQRLIVDM